MHRIGRSVCSGFVAAACLSTSVGAVHAQALTPASTLVSVDQVHDAFASAGYQVDQARAWDWTSPPVTTLQVHDPSTGRVIVAFVYPSPTAAQAGLLEAETHEQALQSGTQTADSPHLIAGYGRSVWNGNVAIVQTTERDIARAYQAQTDRDNGIAVASTAAEAAVEPEFSVDVDFQQALVQRTVSL